MSKTYDKSLAQLEKANGIPGRSLTRSKAPGRLFKVGDGPLYADQGMGATIRDVDGNVFIDMVCALGAISIGYGIQPHAAQMAVGEGWMLSLPHPIEGQAAKVLLRDVAPWATHCRFVKTGSEATHAAYRIAKKATGRNVVMVGNWAYHGWHEWCSTPNVPGTVTYPHGFDIRMVSPENLAAIFVEPHRWEPVSKDWLKSLRWYCDEHGVLLVFDEMIYGGRWALGGATEYFGVTPDLACFGKAIGNGAPIACVVGGKALAEHGEMVSGTYSGDVAALQAVVNTLGFYEVHNVVKEMWKSGARLQSGLSSLVANRDDVVLGGRPVHQRLAWRERDKALRFSAEMAARNVLWHPDVVNVSWSHSDKKIDAVLEAVEDSLKEMDK